jgi:hypothetical protein
MNKPVIPASTNTPLGPQVTLSNSLVPPSEPQREAPARFLPRWPTSLALGALLALLVGGRLLAEPSPALFVTAVVLALIGAVGRRPRGDDQGVRLLLRNAALAHGAIACGTLSLLAWIRGGMHDDDIRNVLLSVGLSLVVAGGALVVVLELLMGVARPTGVVEKARVQRAVWMSWTLLAAAGFLGSSVFAVHKADIRFELAFAAPSSPSGATLALLSSASCGAGSDKPEIFLFFERGSSALAEVDDYFAGLARQGARITTLDQALDPALSKELKVSKNGTVALRCGGRSESYFLGSDRDDAQRKLPKLDQEMRTRLGKVSRDPVTVYFTVGHGERSVDDNDKSGRAAGKSLKRLLEARNVKSRKLGVADGLSSRVPDDAGLVVVFGPTEPFLDQEVRALSTYVEAGGAIAVFLDPAQTESALASSLGAQASPTTAAATLAPLLASLGVSVGEVELVNDKEYVKQTGTEADRTFLFSTSFGNHKAVKTLSGARGRAALLFQQAQKVARLKDAPEGTKVSFVARTAAATFEDLVRNRRFDTERETRGIVDLVAVVETKGIEKEGRALVVGDADVVGDVLIANEANTVFAWDALQWLLRDDDTPAGAVTVDEDVPLRHTRDEDTAVFYGTVLGGPTLLVVVGLAYVHLRRRRSRPLRNAATKGSVG